MSAWSKGSLIVRGDPHRDALPVCGRIAIYEKKVGSSGTDPMKMLLLSQVEETASKKLDAARAEVSIPRCSTRYCIKLYSFSVIYLQIFMLGS